MTVLPGSAAFVAVDDNPSTNLDGETVILNLSRGTYFGLNDAGTIVWQALQRPATIADLRDAVVREFEVAAEVAEADVRSLLAEMIDAGLVRDAARTS